MGVAGGADIGLAAFQRRDLRFAKLFACLDHSIPGTGDRASTTG